MEQKMLGKRLSWNSRWCVLWRARRLSDQMPAHGRHRLWVHRLLLKRSKGRMLVRLLLLLVLWRQKVLRILVRRQAEPRRWRWRLHDRLGGKTKRAREVPAKEEVATP